MCQQNNEAAMCVNHVCEPVECTDESHCSGEKELCQNAKCVEQECRAHAHCEGFFGKNKPAKVRLWKLDLNYFFELWAEIGNLPKNLCHPLLENNLKE